MGSVKLPAAARLFPQALFCRQINYVLKYAIADPDCRIASLDERFLPFPRRSCVVPSLSRVRLRRE